MVVVPKDEIRYENEEFDVLVPVGEVCQYQVVLKGGVPLLVNVTGPPQNAPPVMGFGGTGGIPMETLIDVGSDQFPQLSLALR